MKIKHLVLVASGLMVLSAPAWAGQAKAAIAGTAPGSKLAGEVVLTEESSGLAVEVNLTGLPPGKHGIHIHENGSCDDAGKAAGGHFNPDKMEHGFMPKDGLMHAHPGDMGNIEASADGNAALKILLPVVTLKEGKYAVAGKAVIVHEKVDDFSQPTGNAGSRIGCGIINAN